MNRLAVRLTVLGVIVAGGAIAIAATQFGSREGDATGENPAETAAENSTPKPIPINPGAASTITPAANTQGTSSGASPLLRVNSADARSPSPAAGVSSPPEVRLADGSTHGGEPTSADADAYSRPPADPFGLRSAPAASTDASADPRSSRFGGGSSGYDNRYANPAAPSEPAMADSTGNTGHAAVADGSATAGRTDTSRTTAAPTVLQADPAAVGENRFGAAETVDNANRFNTAPADAASTGAPEAAVADQPAMGTTQQHPPTTETTSDAARPSTPAGQLPYGREPAEPATQFGGASGPAALDRGYSADVAAGATPQYDTGAGAPLESGGIPAAATGIPAAATGTPGDPEQEGPQTPSIVLEKMAPKEIQVGTQATFRIRVRNVGSVAAKQVLVRDEVPQGTRLVETTPAATQTAGGALLWELGEIKPGDQAEVTMTLLPLLEGEIGSVATVSMQAQASARTVCTKPELLMEVSNVPTVLIGDTLSMVIKLTNPGSGTAHGVVIEAIIPDGLSHVAGREIEFEIGSLDPDQTRQLELELKAERAGEIVAQLSARGDGSLNVAKQAQLQVLAPRLEVAVNGPTRRYLQRQAEYAISLANPGTAPAKNVELVAYLPKGLEFIKTNNAGRYDARTHAISWSLEELPAQQTGTVQLTAMPTQMGQKKIRVESNAEMDLAATCDKEIVIEGLAQLAFEIADRADPIEVNGKTTYEIRLVNEGSKPSTNIRLAALLPTDMRALGGEGPTAAVANGQQVEFGVLPRLAPKEETTYRIQVQGLGPGDKRVRVQVLSDEMTGPLIKEEGTRVYADQ